jgi:hypothetical protein
LFALGILCFCTDARAQIDLDPPLAQKKAGPPVRVTPVRDLAFGDVIPGLETTVGHSDPTSGVWDLKVENDAFITINFSALPPALNGAGDSMPVRFESNQALVVVPQLGASYVFDPAVGITVQVGQPGRATVYLGGIASPRGDQSTGAYVSPVTLDAEYAAPVAGPPL